MTPRHEIAFDLVEYIPKFSQFHHDAFFSTQPEGAFAYPAPMAVLYRLLYIWPVHLKRLFVGFALTVLLGLTLRVFRKFVEEGVESTSAARFCAFTLLLSYPFVFELKQGNLEFFVWLIISLGLWLFLRGQGYASATCFAIAGSMKLFPLIYLGLHISQRKWRMAAFGIGLAIAVSTASLWCLDPNLSFAWTHLQRDMGQLQTNIMLKVVPREIGFDHSMFSVVKRALIDFVPLAPVLRLYMIVCAAGGTLLYFLRIRFMPVTNQILSLSVCSILLPPVSYDYTLMHLYAPLVIIALLAVRGSRAKGLTAILMLLGLALAPLSEFIWHGMRFGGQLRALVLLAVLLCALKFPLSPPRPLSEQHADDELHFSPSPDQILDA